MKNILGNRDFSTPNDIREAVKRSVNYAEENLDVAEMFYFFDTSKQRTWLVVTNRRIYILLDDIRKEDVGVNLSFSIERVYQDGKLLIDFNPGYKPNYGLIYFLKGKRGWIYSKSLFPNPEILKTKITNTVRRASMQ